MTAQSILARRDEESQQREERLTSAARYTIEAVSSSTILLWVYGLTGAQGATWAIITAILILQPGLERSLKASGIRIGATLLGATAGTAAALAIPGEAPALLAGIVLTVVLCYFGHLDQHLRQACLTVPIVQMWHQGSILHVSYQRTAAILAGCVVALIVQFAGEGVRRVARLATKPAQPD